MALGLIRPPGPGSKDQRPTGAIGAPPPSSSCRARAAELERDPGRRGEWLTFTVIGAVPTGVEMAGQIAELARDTLRSYFRSADPGSGRILLIEAADRVLTAFPPSLSARG